jgi:excisionase family DNA binding protein
MDVAEVAAYLNRTIPAVRSMVYRQELPHIRISERSVRFDPADIDRWLDARKVAAS